jgi:hypothetical protein
VVSVGWWVSGFGGEWVGGTVDVEVDVDVDVDACDVRASEM